MPVLKLILCCCVGWALYGQEEPPPKPPTEPKPMVEPKPAKPADSKPKKVVKKPPADKQPTPALAAQKILDALAAAIQTLPKDGQPADVIGKTAELQARLN